MIYFVFQGACASLPAHDFITSVISWGVKFCWRVADTLYGVPRVLMWQCANDTVQGVQHVLGWRRDDDTQMVFRVYWYRVGVGETIVRDGVDDVGEGVEDGDQRL